MVFFGECKLYTLCCTMYVRIEGRIQSIHIKCQTAMLARVSFMSVIMDPGLRLSSYNCTPLCSHTQHTMCKFRKAKCNEIVHLPSISMLMTADESSTESDRLVLMLFFMSTSLREPLLEGIFIV